MKDWQRRVVEENAQLNRKIDALTMFLEHEASKDIGIHDRNLLIAQRCAMQHYSDILVRRITYFGGENG